MATVTQHLEVSKPAAAEGNGRALAIVAVFFFMWGLLSCLNESLLSHLKLIFDLSHAQMTFVRLAPFLSCFFLSIPAARLVDWIGYQRTMVAGLLTMGAGAFLFVPAASMSSYPLFLSGLLMMACGMTVLQVSANPYVTILGRSETAASRLSFAQASNSLGAAIAPGIGGLMILSTAPVTLVELRSMSPEALHYYRVAQAASVNTPYVLLGVTLVALAAVMGSSRLPDIVSTERCCGSSIADALRRNPSLISCCIGIFVCFGVEVSIVAMLANYLSQPQIGNLCSTTVVRFVPVYLLGVGIGRLIGAALLRKVRTEMLLAICAVGAAALVLASMVTTGHVAMWSILAVGIFNSIMFPGIFTRGIAGLGPLTSYGSGLMVTAMAGGVVIPFVQGALASHVGMQHAPLVPVLGYLYILVFALRGCRPNAEV